MSGGSHNYLYYTVEETYGGDMHDAEMNELIKDLVEVLHDLEWWQSGDIGEQGYRETVAKFKTKWFGSDIDTRTERLKGYVDKQVESCRKELYKLLGFQLEGDDDE